MTEHFSNPIFGWDCVLTTEHAASCHGIPVLVACGQVYGPADRIDMEAWDWLYVMEGLPPRATAGDLVRVHILDDFGGREPGPGLVAAARRFLATPV